jgi:YfiH family protein
VIYKAPDGFYRSTLLDRLEWLEHGFGTRAQGDWLTGAPVAKVRQTHSAVVWRVDSQLGFLGDGDALYSATPRTWLAVRTADCVPVMLAHSGHRVAAIVHAGWRGAVQEIVRVTLAAMAEDFGSRPNEIVAAIGPSIGRCCFEVGPEVAEQFRRWLPLSGNAKALIDLREALRRQLEEAGIAKESISVSEQCTRCSGDDFHSYRRDKEAAGRMVSALRHR